MNKKRIIGFVISLILLFLFIYYIGWQEIISTLKTANINFLFLTFTSIIIAFIFWMLSLKTNIEAAGINLTYREASKLWLAGAFFNNITPFGRAGGEVGLMYLLSKLKKVEYEKGLAPIMLTHIFDFLPFALFSIGGISFLILNYKLDQNLLALLIFPLILIFLGAILFLLFLLKREKFIKIVLKIIPSFKRFIHNFSSKWSSKINKRKAEEKLDNFYKAIDLISRNKRNMLKVALFSYLGWLFFILGVYFIIRSMNFHVLFGLIVLLIPAGQIASALPLPGGLGGVEITMSGILALVGIPIQVASSAILLFRFFSYWLPTLFGGITAELILKNE